MLRRRTDQLVRQVGARRAAASGKIVQQQSAAAFEPRLPRAVIQGRRSSRFARAPSRSSTASGGDSSKWRPASGQRGQGGDAGVDVGLRLDLLAALARLSLEQREPLLPVCVEQFSYAEVAEVRHIPVGTVMSSVCRARAALRGLLDGPARPAGTTLRRVV
jgi:DNA-directed RNA polymerase specialized sigma24 family protein